MPKEPKYRTPRLYGKTHKTVEKYAKEHNLSIIVAYQTIIALGLLVTSKYEHGTESR